MLPYKPAFTRDEMKIKTLAVAGALAFAFAATPAAAKTFRYAFQGDLNALDPYTLNETFTLGRPRQCHGRPDQARQGPQDHSGPRRALGDRRSAQVALLPAQGRQVPQRRGLHGRRRAVLGRARAQPRLSDQDARAGRHEGRQGRRLHRRFHPDLAQSDPACGVGHLAHLLQEVGRGQRCDAGAGGLRDLAQPVRTQGQRHRSVHRWSATSPA